MEGYMLSLFRSLRFGVLALGVGVGAIGSLASPAAAQWSTVYDQFYYPGPFNWKFRHFYPAADRLFNGFDFGHAILYETLWSKPGAPVAELEEKWYNRLTKDILLHPPRVPLEEGAIEIAYAKLAPEAKLMFDWAHGFHRQVYDVWADERIPPAEKDAQIAQLIRYYKSRPDLAFSSRPKSMELMQEQPYSLAFRQNYPKFNGLIWAYHWLQVGLYEPLVTGRNVDERQAGVRAAVARFWQMLGDPPTTLPYQMPMTAAVAPMFAARYPEAAIIFDNLHSMHDVVSDILANPSVSRDRKRAEILRAAALFRDDSSYVMPIEAWRVMAREMGVENMGGPAVGFLSELPTPTVTRGAVMEHDVATGKMIGMKVGEMVAGHDMAGMQGMPAMAPGRDSGRVARDTMAGMDHARMNMPGMRDTTRMDHGAAAATDSAMMATMMAMHMRMMADPVIRQRMMADTAMRRMMDDVMKTMATDQRDMMSRMMREPARPPGAAAARRPAARRPAARTPAKPAARPAARPEDPHAGHGGAAPGQPAPAKPAPAKPAPKPPAKPPAKRDSMPGMDHSKMPGMGKP
jgi:hypothetical protein